MESKIDYELSDSHLVSLIRENNEDAKDFLYEKYSPMIHKEVNRVKKIGLSLGIELADLSQEAMLAFSNAINNYNENEDAKFITFATLCVRRKLINYIAKYSSNKNKIFKDSIPLDSNYYSSNLSLVDTLKDGKEKDPLSKVMTTELVEEINNDIKQLSDNEKMALKYSLDGLNIEDIANLMNMTSKQIYNLIYRARQKLKNKL